MSELPLSATGSERLPVSWHGTDDDLRSQLLRLVMFHLAAMALLGIAASVLLTTNPSPGLQYAVLGGGIVGCAAIVTTAVFRVRATASIIDQRIDESVQTSKRWIEDSERHTKQWIDDLRSTVEQGKKEFPQLLERVRGGDYPAPRWPVDEPAAGCHPFELLSYEVRQAQAAIEFAVVRVQHVSGVGADPTVAVFANIARRVQSLAHRAIQRLDELEQLVEDPDLLKGLFAVDHLVTGVRRQAESLAVLGGSMPRRQWSRPVAMYTVLRSAVAEVEHYARVKVIPPVPGTVHGHAVADVIHLVAELVENATACSEPDTQVTVSTQRVTAGLAIDIRDRGLGIRPDDRAQLNALLANPGSVDRDERLKDGRIGLYVVAQLAQRHHVAVELENNMYGGTDAHVVIPRSMLGDPETEEAESAPAEIEAVPSAVALSESYSGTAVLSAGVLSEPQSDTAVPQVVSRASMSASDREGAGGRRGAHRARTDRPSAPRYVDADQLAPRRYLDADQPAPRRYLDADQPVASSDSDTARWYASPPGFGSDPATAVGDATSYRPSDNDQRPPLPKRDRTKTYVAPQLAGGPTSPNGPRGGLNPGLWAAYRQGVEGGARDSDGPGDHRV
ncbi:ATP-binding protein [Saccharopolyspora sp. K220]|uniref:sensor histidine kinase n=1 Tax=Saccharopolyspora soli TaxID=2926618 RepID=UPI001F564D12|nr:ATP-binding protein [Saccharopolyspora soli]MCI2416643.1 ATP-binding protein [Saccharopolyspora soli]